MDKKRRADHIARDNAGVPGKELAVRDQRFAGGASLFERHEIQFEDEALAKDN
ncbi:hypothetical protein [Mesorhizobium sp.]|uniref:hypothetical protein n=1 Tax=Mesorhizobium sp. TaxID=1871066 RepID=UPI0025837A4C|nr:hypothetical protein [Mesorhizobium sp.]